MMTTTNTDSVPSVSAEVILGLLRRQVPLLAKLESYASKQRTLITGNDAGNLLSLLADRQKIAAELADIHTQLEPIRAQWTQERERLDASQQDEADRLVADIQQRLSRVMQTDEQDVRLLAARKQSTAQTLRSAHSTEQAISAYRTPSGTAERVDRWSEET